MLILGLNAYHADSAACIVRDGKLIAAVEEERFRRVKHWAGFPSHAIAYCLAEAGANLADVDHVALNQDTRANMLRRLGFVVASRPTPGAILQQLHKRGERASVGEELARHFPNDRFGGQIHAVEHHLAHLSSAFHVSPFANAAAVSVDGFGDFTSAAWGTGQGSEIAIEAKVHFPHSLGVFYQALTQYLGFPNYGDEYKVMGLAPYGVPRFTSQLGELIKICPDGRFKLDTRFFRHAKEGVPVQWDCGTPVFEELFSSALVELLGTARCPADAVEQVHMDLARSVQEVYEDAFFNLLRAAHRGSGSTDLVLAGGCANNSVANGKVRRLTPFRRVYVHAAPGDQGGAIGAAFSIWHKLGGERSFVMDHAYWGPEYDEAACGGALTERQEDLDVQTCSTTLCADTAALAKRAADAIAAGKVVGWFQGRMEWGPRALGNRSIVCDPRRADMKKILNAKIKRREGFRPFAPSVLADHVGEWFEEDDAVPFMMQVFQIREEKRALIPAVTHVDGSGRLQTVTFDANPRYAQLIAAFHALTGVPMVLNTSFNENEPVVCTPAEALDCFLRTRMDVLVLGNWYVERADFEGLAEQ